MQTMTTVDTPEWFLRALAHRPESHFANSHGTRIHYLAWNAHEMHKPALLFAHGFLGHAHWWDFIAPFFTDRFRVFALDFAGMGDSGWRSEYDGWLFAEDLAVVIADGAMTTATVIGHSFGGSRVLRLCADHPDQVSQAIILDSRVLYGPDDFKATTRLGSNPNPYPNLEAALARFRLMPEQPALAFARDHIARHSLREVADGWTWKFDRSIGRAQRDDLRQFLPRIGVRVDYVFAELSLVASREQAETVVRALSCVRGPIMIPQAHHHLMLDQPLALISALTALLADCVSRT